MMVCFSVLAFWQRRFDLVLFDVVEEVVVVVVLGLVLFRTGGVVLSLVLTSASMAFEKALLVVDFEVEFGLVVFCKDEVESLDGAIVVESSSSLLRSIVESALVSLMEVKEESYSMKIDIQAAAARDSKPFLKNFCLEGMSFLISKIAFILVSFLRILKKLSAC